MAKRIVDHDPLTGITTWFDYDPATDTSYVGRVQDAEAILEVNKALAKESSYTREGMRDAWLHYATIPLLLIEKWKAEEGIDVFNKDHARRVFQKLNAPEYRYLKTTNKVHIPRR